MDRWQHRWAKHVKITDQERHSELLLEAGMVYGRQERESWLSLACFPKELPSLRRL
jgi:hypothetical protein